MSSKNNPYISIWLRPRSTFHSMFYENFEQPTYLLPFVLLGASAALDSLNRIKTLYDVRTSDLIILGILGFFIVITIMIYLFLGRFQPWLIRLIGKIWNGKTTSNELSNVISLSFVPYSLSLLYQLVLLISGQDPSLENVNGGFQFLLWIVSTRILIIGVSVAQEFSYGISLLNILLSSLPIFLIYMMIKG